MPVANKNISRFPTEKVIILVVIFWIKANPFKLKKFRKLQMGSKCCEDALLQHEYRPTFHSQWPGQPGLQGTSTTYVHGEKSAFTVNDHVCFWNIKNIRSKSYQTNVWKHITEKQNNIRFMCSMFHSKNLFNLICDRGQCFRSSPGVKVRWSSVSLGIPLYSGIYVQTTRLLKLPLTLLTNWGPRACLFLARARFLLAGRL